MVLRLGNEGVIWPSNNSTITLPIIAQRPFQLRRKRDALPGVNWLTFLEEAMKTTYNTTLHTPSMLTSEGTDCILLPDITRFSGHNNPAG